VRQTLKKLLRKIETNLLILTLVNLRREQQKQMDSMSKTRQYMYSSELFKTGVHPQTFAFMDTGMHSKIKMRA
jgi:hypothetical protein